MYEIYLVSFESILGAFDSDTWNIIYRDASYIIIKLYIEKTSPQKKRANKKTCEENPLNPAMRYPPLKRVEVFTKESLLSIQRKLLKGYITCDFSINYCCISGYVNASCITR